MGYAEDGIINSRIIEFLIGRFILFLQHWKPLEVLSWYGRFDFYFKKIIMEN